jgi:hypothetical protein
MLRAVQLSAADLAIIATACWALAERYREDAKRYEHPDLREAAIARARHAERLAEFCERQRDRV